MATKKRKKKVERPRKRRADGSPVPPPADGPITATDLLRGVGALLRSEAGKLAAAAVVLVQLPALVLILIGDPVTTVVGHIWAMLVSYVGGAAAVHLALQHQWGKSPSLGRALKAGLRSWIGLIAAFLFAELIVLAFSIFLIVPGVMRWLGYALIVPLVVSGECFGPDALGVSFRRMKGHRLPAFYAYLGAYVPLVIWFGLASLVIGPGRALGDAFDPAPTAGLRLAEAGFMLLYLVCDLPELMLSAVLYERVPRAPAPV